MSCDDYLKLFCAQVDTINAHGGRTGFHWATYQAKLEMIRVRDNYREHFVLEVAQNVATLDDCEIRLYWVLGAEL